MRPSTEETAEAASSEQPRIGVLSDTHGYLDPAILDLFAGVTHIIHAGDIVDAGILTALAAVAPLTAVSGNLDVGDLAATLADGIHLRAFDEDARPSRPGDDQGGAVASGERVARV